MSFYNKYYLNLIKNRKKLQQHKQNLKKLRQDPDKKLESLRDKVTTTIQESVISANNASRQLENLSTGFKTVFLKILGYDFVQQVVVENEDEDYKPIILQLDDFKAMGSFIKDSTADFQGKLKTNQDILTTIQNKNSHNKLFKKIIVAEPYMEIYKESRRRLNIFYEKTKKPAGGEGLLLYKPENEWIRFYVLNLGDLKEGYVSMIADQPNVNTNKMEKNIQIFAEEYIGKVDNVIGTLWQDVQTIINAHNVLISVKSGSAQTGTHEGLVDLIDKISKGKVEQIYDIINDVLQRDKALAQKGSGRRDRVYDDDESKKKIASMIFKSSEKKARKEINFTLQQLKKAGNVLIQIQKEIEASN